MSAGPNAIDWCEWGCDEACAAIIKRLTAPPADLAEVSARLSELRIQRDQLIRQHPGSLREIGQAAGLSPQAVLNIRNRKEEK